MIKALGYKEAVVMDTGAQLDHDVKHQENTLFNMPIQGQIWEATTTRDRSGKLLPPRAGA